MEDQAAEAVIRVPTCRYGKPVAVVITSAVGGDYPGNGNAAVHTSDAWN